MDWTRMVIELIDLRSFSNLWFWIALAVVWSSASHWVLGVPFDIVLRARRQGGQAETDLHDIVRVNINRMLYVEEVAGAWLLAFVCFVLTGLGILAFAYWVEFAQAVFVLALPMSLIGLLSLRTAHKIRDETLEGEPLRACLSRHRLWTQVLGMVSIFGTAMFGMYQNIAIGPLGG